MPCVRDRTIDQLEQLEQPAGQFCGLSAGKLRPKLVAVDRFELVDVLLARLHALQGTGMSRHAKAGHGCRRRQLFPDFFVRKTSRVEERSRMVIAYSSLDV